MAKITTKPTLPFPAIPNRWTSEERLFGQGLNTLLDQIQLRNWQKAYPVGIVVLTATNVKPFDFGEWESVSTGISGVYGWKRVRT